ncbi:MAG: hypothetical protein ACYTFK_09810 [Planctomycetota bacterium]
METEQNQVPQNTEELKEIPKWTRKYAQNRALPVLISLLIFACIFAGIAIPSHFGGKAYRAGNMVLFWICVFVSAIAMISLFFFCVPKWGGKFIERITQRVYAGEGSISISVPESMKKKKWVGYMVAMIFGSCILGSVILGFMGYFTIEYMQPISALYCVPFLVFLYCWQRPMVSPVVLLWPTLYGIHAILIVTGMPILFTEYLTPLNMILPVFGYGFLTHIIGHVYSRYALNKLKTAAHLQEDTNEQ